jgi:hypothetical protein
MALQPLFGENGWRRENVSLFRSDESLRWYLRDHRQELVAGGALVLHANRWLVDPDRMLAAIMGIARRDALAACGPADSESANRVAA